MEAASFDLKTHLEEIKKLTPDEQREILALVDQLEEAKGREKAQLHFLDFVKEVWPAFIAGRHHAIMADAF